MSVLYIQENDVKMIKRLKKNECIVYPRKNLETDLPAL